MVVAAASLAFLLLHFAPGDPMSAMADMANVSPELRAQWRAQQGFDQPILVQYGRWMSELARGELGYSTNYHRPVRDVIADHLPRTMLLMSLALAASVVFGAWLGAWQGARAGSRADRSVSWLSLLLYSVPEFWLALLLSFLFAYKWHLLPASGMVSEATYDYMSTGQQLLDRLKHLVLPWLSLTLIGTAIFARYQRSAMHEALRAPYVRTARAKGLSARGVHNHAWRNAILPVVTVVGLFFPALVTGAVFVESIFGWNGMGNMLIAAIGARDYALVSAAVIVGSAMTALGSLFADVVRTLVDPRLRAS